MRIIDAHIHFSDIKSFKETAKELSKVDYSYNGYIEEFEDNNIVASIGMGVEEVGEGNFPDSDSPNPMRLDLNEKIPDNIHMCLGINPIKLMGSHKDRELYNIEEHLKKNQVIGMKIYAGYYHYHVYDNVYMPIYRLAAKYNVPIVIHAGDTYSERGLLKYSHPLGVDEIAVNYRDVTFVIAHLGDPWVMDCAEVVYKNPNVYADISGLIVGDKKQVERLSGERLFMDHIKRALVYLDNYKKILFGSDWPLVDLKAYIYFVKKLIPEEYHQDVFFNNAKDVFNLII